MKKNAFTIIELIVVLVVLAVVALIVTPLVLNILNQAEINARKSSIDGYGKAAELAVINYKFERGIYPTNFSELKINYKGNEVKCADSIINQDGSVFLSKCKVNGEIVKEKNKEIYYTYGKLPNEYNIGDKVTFNGIDFYVIRPSNALSEYVTLLKASAFTYEEILLYGEGHINMHNYMENDSYYRVPNNVNGYGYMAYYTSEACGYDANGNRTSDGCTTNYDESEAKYVVDSWVNNNINFENLKEDDLGYKARLITYDDLTDYLGYNHVNSSTIYPSTNGDTPSFVYDSKYGYWTMSPSSDNNEYVWIVMSNGGLYKHHSVTRTEFDSYVDSYAIRPIINLNKKVIKE